VPSELQFLEFMHKNHSHKTLNTNTSSPEKRKSFNNKLPLVVILGPTASGKTDLVCILSKSILLEVITCDSMQCYKGMDIGTNKPTKEIQSAVRHHLLDIKNPNESYNAGEFGHLANNAVRDIRKRNILPVIVAGTPLYLHTFLYGIMNAPSASPELRAKFEQEAKRNGTESLWERLRRIDPERASQIHPHNLRRIIRALEIYELTGSTMSDLLKTTKPYKEKLLLFGLRWPMKELYQRINDRVNLMFEGGLVKEVKLLLKRFQNRSMPALQAIGYKEVVKYLDGNYTLDEAIEEVKKNTRRFARKQMAWWKREKNIFWLECRHQRDISESARLIVQQVKKQVRYNEG